MFDRLPPPGFFFSFSPRLYSRFAEASPPKWSPRLLESCALFWLTVGAFERKEKELLAKATAAYR